MRSVVQRAGVKPLAGERQEGMEKPKRARRRKKVRSLIDKVYQRKNLELAWSGRANGGSGGATGRLWTLIARSSMSNWSGCGVNGKRMLINRNRYGRHPSRM
jgi:hypothetical protein